MTSDREKEKVQSWYKPGHYRPFFSTERNPAIIELTKLNKLDHFSIFALLSLGVLVRLYKIPLPKQVVFDEVHFGGFAQDYHLGQFFVDVHPPLGKLIYYWIAAIFQWDGKFGFEQIGDYYDSSVPYVPMRLFSGVCGVFTVVLTYLILRASSCRSLVAFFGSFLVLIENSMVTQSRFILLDSPLLFGFALTIFAFKRFRLEEPFTRQWYKFLVLTGLGLGISISIKLTGLYVALWIGILASYDLWLYLGDLNVPMRTLLNHFVVRLFGFVLLPFTIYLGFFAVHFIHLPLNGSGSGSVSPNFKSTFEDSNDLINMPVDVSYGSSVTIKHQNLESFLHSHNFTYPTGSGEQQVTLYGFASDLNNEWIIEIKNKTPEGMLQKNFKKISDGDIIRLYHKQTGKYLHVNDVRPPVSEHDYANEVSCAGGRDLLADINYEFKVRIVGKRHKHNLNLSLLKLRATETVFQLIHKGTKCILIAHEDKLPAWGSKQNEVLCVEEPTIPNSLWYIEYNSHPAIDDNVAEYPRVDFGTFSFWDKFVEYHKAMIRINKSFTETHEYSSHPGSWPFVLRGINYFGNDAGNKLTDEDGSHVYLLGNVPIYYIGFFLVTLIIAKHLVRLFKYLNPFYLYIETLSNHIFFEYSFEYILGWVLNFFPYFLMSRQLFAHHYLPALYFTILLIAQFVEYQASNRRFLAHIFMVLVVFFAVFFFVHFMPLVYGLTWTKQICNESKWLPTWDFNCLSYEY